MSNFCLPRGFGIDLVYPIYFFTIKKTYNLGNKKAPNYV